MKISVGPMPKGDAVGKYILCEKLGRAYEELEHRYGRPRMGNDGSHAENKRKVIMAFAEIGYEPGRSVGDAIGVIRFQSNISGGMKDLVFKDWDEAKDWLVKAECWKN